MTTEEPSLAREILRAAACASVVAAAVALVSGAIYYLTVWLGLFRGFLVSYGAIFLACLLWFGPMFYRHKVRELEIKQRSK